MKAFRKYESEKDERTVRQGQSERAVPEHRIGIASRKYIKERDYPHCVQLHF